MSKYRPKYCCEYDIPINDLKIPFSDFIKEIENTNQSYCDFFETKEKKIIHYIFVKENKIPKMITLKLLNPNTFANYDFLMKLVVRFTKKHVDFRYY
jgi:hypothetical protein